MKILERILRADESRKSRFHTSSGVLCLDPIEVTYASVTTLRRVLFGSFTKQPWLVRKALPLIRNHVTNARVFEYGAGMSTLWFANNAAEVTSVESNNDWARRINTTLSLKHKKPVTLVADPEAYARYIRSCDGMFDIILVDGINRKRCVEEAVVKLKAGGLLILDNTDVNVDLIPAALAQGTFEVRRFIGYSPGVLHPSETSILTKQL